MIKNHSYIYSPRNSNWIRKFTMKLGNAKAALCSLLLLIIFCIPNFSPSSVVRVFSLFYAFESYGVLFILTPFCTILGTFVVVVKPLAILSFLWNWCSSTNNKSANLDLLNYVDCSFSTYNPLSTLPSHCSSSACIIVCPLPGTIVPFSYYSIS